jgi:hypothetical protein
MDQEYTVQTRRWTTSTTAKFVAVENERTGIFIDYEHHHIDTIRKIRCGIGFY